MENILGFIQRFFTVEILIMVLLIAGVFLTFSYFIQDLFRDYFREFEQKKKTAGSEGPGKKKAAPSGKKAVKR